MSYSAPRTITYTNPPIDANTILEYWSRSDYVDLFSETGDNRSIGWLDGWCTTADQIPLTYIVEPGVLTNSISFEDVVGSIQHEPYDLFTGRPAFHRGGVSMKIDVPWGPFTGNSMAISNVSVAIVGSHSPTCTAVFTIKFWDITDPGTIVYQFTRTQQTDLFVNFRIAVDLFGSFGTGFTFDPGSGVVTGDVDPYCWPFDYPAPHYSNEDTFYLSYDISQVNGVEVSNTFNQAAYDIAIAPIPLEYRMSSSTLLSRTPVLVSVSSFSISAVVRDWIPPETPEADCHDTSITITTNSTSVPTDGQHEALKPANMNGKVYYWWTQFLPPSDPYWIANAGFVEVPLNTLYSSSNSGPSGSDGITIYYGYSWDGATYTLDPYHGEVPVPPMSGHLAEPKMSVEYPLQHRWIVHPYGWTTASIVWGADWTLSNPALPAGNNFIEAFEVLVDVSHQTAITGADAGTVTGQQGFVWDFLKTGHLWANGGTMFSADNELTQNTLVMVSTQRFPDPHTNIPLSDIDTFVFGTFGSIDDDGKVDNLTPPGEGWAPNPGLGAGTATFTWGTPTIRAHYTTYVAGVGEAGAWQYTNVVRVWNGVTDEVAGVIPDLVWDGTTYTFTYNQGVMPHFIDWSFDDEACYILVQYDGVWEATAPWAVWRILLSTGEMTLFGQPISWLSTFQNTTHLWPNAILVGGGYVHVGGDRSDALISETGNPTIVSLPTNAASGTPWTLAYTNYISRGWVETFAGVFDSNKWYAGVFLETDYSYILVSSSPSWWGICRTTAVSTGTHENAIWARDDKALFCENVDVSTQEFRYTTDGGATWRLLTRCPENIYTAGGIEYRNWVLFQVHMLDTDTMAMGALETTPRVSDVVFITDVSKSMDWGGPWIGAVDESAFLPTWVNTV